MVNLDLAKYKNLYLQTAREHLIDIKKNLALLDANPTDKQVIYEVFRLFHSLKSQNYFMGFEQTAHFCKILEVYLRKINQGESIYQPALFHLILEAIIKLENSLASIEKENKEIDLSSDIISLEKALI